MKILVTDRISEEGLDIFRRSEGVTLEYCPGIAEEELLIAVRDASALVVRGGTRVTSALLEAAPRLKVVARAGISVENIDLEAAGRRGVVVMNTPLGSALTSAEHTVAMLLALSRCIPQGDRSLREGSWRKDAYLGVEVAGKTLGILGAGRIGRLVLERALALKMRVLVHDPYLSGATVRTLGAEPVSFEGLLFGADFLTVHVPLTHETAHVLDDEALSKLKPGCRIINCAQGGLVDEAALVRAIESGRVAGAALDVFEKEPPDPDNPLFAIESVICTPHLRAATRDAQASVALQIARQVLDFLHDGVIANALNVPPMAVEQLSRLRPYLLLAERLGSFQAQLRPGELRRVVVEYAGEVAKQETAPLTLALLKGLLGPMLGATVNYVNAPHLAQELGMEVVESRSTASQGFTSLIRLTTVHADGERSVWGALFAESEGRIVRVDDFPVEAIPEGTLLVLRNNDRPGVLAYVGKVLAQAGINIAMMNLSRRKIQGRAISLINLDSLVSEEVLEELLSYPDILSAHQVSL